jgi:hypothetical protein
MSSIPSAAASKRGQPSRYLNGGTSLLVRRPRNPGENLVQVGAWSREQLMRMNDRFVAAMERAFASGREFRSSASNQQRPSAGDLDRLAS